METLILLLLLRLLSWKNDIIRTGRSVVVRSERVELSDEIYLTALSLRFTMETVCVMRVTVCVRMVIQHIICIAVRGRVSGDISYTERRTDDRRSVCLRLRVLSGVVIWEIVWIYVRIWSLDNRIDVVSSWTSS